MGTHDGSTSLARVPADEREIGACIDCGEPVLFDDMDDAGRCESCAFLARPRECAECFRSLTAAKVAFTDRAGNDFCRDCERDVRAQAARRRA